MRFRYFCAHKKLSRAMARKVATEVDHARVVECAIFATRNSLKSLVSRNLNPHLATLVPDRRSCARLRARLASTLIRSQAHAPQRRTRPRIPSRDFLHWRFSYAGRREPAASFVSGRHPKIFTLGDIRSARCVIVFHCSSRKTCVTARSAHSRFLRV